MNPPLLPNTPPPLPKSANKTLARQAAAGSLLAPLLAILVSAAAHASSQTQMPRAVTIVIGLACLIFIVAGLVMGIIGLCGIKRHGSHGILGKSIAGLLINGLLLVFFISGFENGIKSRRLTQDLKNTAQELQAAAKKSYDPKTGITNMDVSDIDRLRNQFDSAAQTMSGDDALIAQAMSGYASDMETAAKKYQSAVTGLRTAEVLSLKTFSDQKQITSRRDVVNRFLAANGSFENVISNSAESLRANMIRLQVSPEKMNAAMGGFQAKAATRYPLLLQIRACDDRMGQAMLSLLDLLETNWGKWNYDPATNVVLFDDTHAQHSYREFLGVIKSAGQEQIKAQGELVNLQ